MLDVMRKLSGSERFWVFASHIGEDHEDRTHGWP